MTIFSMTLDPHAANHAWVTYKLLDAVGTIQYVGFCRLSQMTVFPDARSNPFFAQIFPKGKPVTLEVMAIHADKNKARNAVWSYFLDNPRPFMQNVGPRHRYAVPIECVETGEKFDSMQDACKAHGLSSNALSRHIKGESGFRSVKGKTYKRAVPLHTPTQP